MPRVKSTPIKRSAHRFESTGSNAVGEERSILEGVIALDAESEDDIYLQDHVESPVPHTQKTSIAAAVAAQVLFATKEVPGEIWRPCTKFEMTKLSTEPRIRNESTLNMLLLSIRTIGFTTIGVPKPFIACKGTSMYIGLTENEAICCDLPTSLTRIMSHYIHEKKLHIEIIAKEDVLVLNTYLLLPPNFTRFFECPFPPLLLDWCLCPVYHDQTWASTLLRTADRSEFYQKYNLNSINGEEFLNKLSGTISHLHPPSETDELHAILRMMGIETALRPYQLEGVLWMYNTLTKTQLQQVDGPMVIPTTTNHSSSTNRANTKKIGWLEIRCPLLSSVFKSCWSCWYDILSQSIFVFPDLDQAHQYMISSTTTSTANQERGCILADEMGIGKSLEILSLVLYFRFQNEQMKHCMQSSGSTTTANNTPTTAISEAKDEEYAMLSFLQARYKEVGSNYKGLRRKKRSSNRFPVVQEEENDFEEEECIEYACYCGRSDCEVQRDIGWIECMACKKWRHIGCEFTSYEEAMEKEVFVCYPCQALYYYHHPKTTTQPVTLMIVPNTLLQQWQNEIRKHCPPQLLVKTPGDNENTNRRALKIMEYEYVTDTTKAKKGVVGKKQKYTTMKELSSHDMIFMSLTTLKKCFHMTKIPWNEYAPSTNRSDLFPPIIFGIHFNLIVIDETQNIENTSSSQHAKQATSAANHENQISAMACQFAGTYRVSVSGTPLVNHQIADLYALIRFLRLSPCVNTKLWTETILCPSILPVSKAMRLQWLEEYFHHIVLRRTKAMVEDQLGLTESTVIVRSLKFSPFEMALYQEFVQKMIVSISNATTSSTSRHILDKEATGKVQLETLRKGCSHPQLLDRTMANATHRGGRSGAHGQTVGGNAPAGPRPMDQIMIIKVEQTRLACEESQRSLLMYLFRMAGLTLLKLQYKQLTMNYLERHESGGVDTSLVRLTKISETPDELVYTAFSLYWIAHEIIQSHRQPVPLIALCNVSGDYNFHVISSNQSLLQGQVTPQLRCCMEEMSSLTWWFTVQRDTGTADVGEVEEEEDAYQSSCIWYPVIDQHSAEQLRGWLEHSNTTETIAISKLLHISPYAQFHFHQSKSLQSTLLRFSVPSLITWLSQCFLTTPANIQQRTQQQSLLDSKSLQSMEEETDEEKVVEEKIFCCVFPKEYVLQASVHGINDHYITVSEHHLPLHMFLQQENAGTSQQQVLQDDEFTVNTISMHRSKHWRVKVQSVHSTALLLRYTKKIVNGTEESLWTYSFSPLETAWRSQRQSCNGYDWIGMHFHCRLFESQFDTDIYQELHLCHNYLDVVQQCMSMSMSMKEDVRNHHHHNNRLIELRRLLCGDKTSELTDTTHLKGKNNFAAKNATMLEVLLKERLANLSTIVNNVLVEEEDNPSSTTGTREDRVLGKSSNKRSFTIMQQCEETPTTLHHDEEVDNNMFPNAFQPHIESRQQEDISHPPELIKRGKQQVVLTSDDDVKYSFSKRFECISQQMTSTAEDRRLNAFSKFCRAQEKVNECEEKLLEAYQRLHKPPEEKEEEKSENEEELTNAKVGKNDTMKGSYHSVVPARRDWYVDVLTRIYEDDYFQQILGAMIEQHPSFRKLLHTRSASGLLYFLGQEYDALQASRKKVCNALMKKCSVQPSDEEIVSSRTCQQCRQYFHPHSGYTCAHCMLFQTQLNPYKHTHLVLLKRGSSANNEHASSSSSSSTAFSRVAMATGSPMKKPTKGTATTTTAGAGVSGRIDWLLQEEEEEEGDTTTGITAGKTTSSSSGNYHHDDAQYTVDGLYSMLMKCIHQVIMKYHLREYYDLASAEIAYTEALVQECISGVRLWDRYSELLKVYDEIEQCKARVQLYTQDIQPLLLYDAKNQKHNHNQKQKEKQEEVDDEEGEGNGGDFYYHPSALSGEYLSSMQSVMLYGQELMDLQRKLSFYKEQVHGMEEEERTYQNDAFLTVLGSRATTTTTTATASSSTTTSTANTAVRKETCPICMESLFSPPKTTKKENEGNSMSVRMVGEQSSSSSDGEVEVEEGVDGNGDCSDGGDVVILPCMHRYHRVCIMRWIVLPARRKCPMCKAMVTVHQLTSITMQRTTTNNTIGIPSGTTITIPTNTIPTSTIGIPATTSSSSSSSLRCSIIPLPLPLTGSTTAVVGGEDTATGMAYQHMLRTVKGRWGTKVDALMADLLLLFAPPYSTTSNTTSNTTSTSTNTKKPLKVIVFSQWMELLEIVGAACRVNKLPCVFCKERRKDFESVTGGLERFRHEEEIGILLLPLSYGAEGLDLIIASHVFLLEPIVSYSQELQAINRIHRLGQTHPTYVHKYLILGTVEENIFLWQQQQRQQHSKKEEVEEEVEEGGVLSSMLSMVPRKRDDELLHLQDILQLVSSCHTV